MSGRIVAVQAAQEHIPALVARMRDADRRECLATGAEPAATLQELLHKSELARTAFVGEEPMAMFGVIRRGAGPALIWSLTTDAVDRHPKAFWRASKAVMQQLGRVYPVLTQCVDARYAAAVRWVRRLGFEVDDESHRCGPMGMPFFRATYFGEG
jgi:hypothetical protein